MGPDLIKMSDEELTKRLDLINSRINWAATCSHSPNLLNQLYAMQQEVTNLIRERMDRAMMEQKLAATPSVINIDGPKEKRQIEDNNSRAKARSDMITRLRRTTTPTNLKDA